MSFGNFLKLLVRTRRVDIAESDTLFNRCLSAVDLTLLGVGSMLGAGLYVAAVEIARSTAGPAIVLSLLIAAFPAILSSLCYAEFGSRISRTGSSYVYTYFSLGEIWSFVVGWNLILETTIATALMGHEMSRFVNNICGNQISGFLESHLGSYHVRGFLPYPDFLGCAFVLMLTILTASGARLSALFIRVATIINLLVILFVILSGFYFMNVENWSSLQKFAPFGFGGILDGAALSYFSFLGFDILNNASEETKHPKRSIPFAGNVSTYIGVLIYLITAAMLTLMIPYTHLPPQSILPEAFEHEGFLIGKYFVAVGGLFALSTALLGYNFAGSRILYAMSNDGLIFPFFKKISVSRQVPLRAVSVCGLAAACVCLFLDVHDMVEMLSIGTLLAYTAIPIAVLLERYRPRQETLGRDLDEDSDQDENANPSAFEKFLRRKPSGVAKVSRADRLLSETATKETHRLASIGVACLAFAAFGLSLSVSPTKGMQFLKKGHPWVTASACLTGLMYILATVLLFILPRRTPSSYHVVPYVPLLPLMSISINVYLLGNLASLTWATFSIWMFIGEFLFFLSKVNYLPAKMNFF